MTTAFAQGMAVSCPESAKYYSKDSVNVTTFGARTVEGVNGLDFQTSLEQNFKRCYPNKAISITKYGVGEKIIVERFLQFTVSHNYPNPTRNGRTTFDVVMPEPDKITINFYSIHGQQMRYAINEYLNAGKHSISIDLTSFPVGLYIQLSHYTSLGLNSDYKKLIVAR